MVIIKPHWPKQICHDNILMFFFTPIVIITSVTTNKKKLAIAFANIVIYSLLYWHVGTIIVHTCANHIIKHMIPHTPSQVSVLQSITFANISDEGRLVLLAKLCVPVWNLFCSGGIRLNDITYTEWETYMNVCWVLFWWVIHVISVIHAKYHLQILRSEMIIQISFHLCIIGCSIVYV